MRKMTEAIEVSPSPQKRARRDLARALSLPLGREAANDAQGTRTDGPGPHGFQKLEEIIRELVRHEVRAEVARLAETAPASPKYVSVAEYAIARSISASTVRNAIRSGRLPAIRIGAAVRVPVDVEIGSSVAANANAPGASPVARADRILDRKRQSLDAHSRTVAARADRE
jgi:hypothetical protein